MLSAHAALKHELQGNKLFESIIREGQETPELWETNSEVLFEITVTYNNLVHTLIEKVKVLEDEITPMENELKVLQEKNRVLERSVEKLQENQLKFMVGQLAFEIYTTVVHKVLGALLIPMKSK